MPQAPVAPRTPTDSAYAAQLARGFRWLRFDSTLEADFRESVGRRYVVRGRIILTLAIAIFAAFGVANRVGLPAGLAMPAFLIELLVVCPWLLGVLGLSFLPEPWRFMVTVAWLGLLGAGIGLLTLIGYCEAQGYPYAYSGLLLVLMVSYFLAALPFYQASVFGWLLWLAFLV